MNDSASALVWRSVDDNSLAFAQWRRFVSSLRLAISLWIVMLFGGQVQAFINIIPGVDIKFDFSTNPLATEFSSGRWETPSTMVGPPELISSATVSDIFNGNVYNWAHSSVAQPLNALLQMDEMLSSPRYVQEFVYDSPWDFAWVKPDQYIVTQTMDRPYRSGSLMAVRLWNASDQPITSLFVGMDIRNITVAQGQPFYPDDFGDAAIHMLMDHSGNERRITSLTEKSGEWTTISTTWSTLDSLGEPWAPGTSRAIFFMDDNAKGVIDNAYALDNFVFRVIPEPSSAVLASLGAVWWGRRSRRPPL